MCVVGVVDVVDDVFDVFYDVVWCDVYFFVVGDLFCVVLFGFVDCVFYWFGYVVCVEDCFVVYVLCGVVDCLD